MSRTESRTATLAGAGLLAAVLAVAAGIALAIGDTGPAQRQAVGFAAVVVMSGSLGGWLTARWGRGRSPGIAAATATAATLVRLTPPLAALAWLASTGGPLAAGGAREFLVIFYLVLLATDVFLHIMEGAGAARRGRGTDAN